MAQRRSSVMPPRSSHVLDDYTCPVREVSMCVFLQSDTTITIFFCGSHLVRLLFKGGCYFEGGVYFFGKPTDINNGWIRYMYV